MKLGGIFAVSALLATSLVANAADMAPPVMPVKAPAVVNPVVNWTGLYLGATAGIGLHSSNFQDADDEIVEVSKMLNQTTFNVGGTVGYNWQVRSAVFGLEGDGSWTNFNTTGQGYSTTSVQARTDWFSTLRARAGWATDNLLLYVTGGAAFVNYKNAAQYNYSPYFCGQSGGYWSCPSGVSTGIAAGGGIEAMMAQHWSLKLEYLYLGLPSVKTIDITRGTGYSWNNNAQILRAGVNYHF